MTTMSTTTAAAPRILGSARVVEMLGNRLELLVEHRDFPRASVVRYTVAPGFAAPPQLHHHVARRRLDDRAAGSPRGDRR